LNYYREPALSRYQLDQEELSQADLLSMAERMIDSANSIRASLSQAEIKTDFKTIARKAEENFKNHDFGPDKSRFPAVKASLLSPFMNYLGTSGYFNPFSAESQVNTDMPVYVQPFICSHELAHQ